MCQLKSQLLLQLLVVITVLSNSTPIEAKTFQGKRAIFDGDIELWTDEKEFNTRLARIREADFNVYMPTVWQGRGTTWPSKTAFWDPVLSSVNKSSFDPLRNTIARCHAAGIEVHPWFTVAFRWGKEYFPELGLPGVRNGPHAAFDVHSPAFHTFITNLILEVVVNYDIDGLNLDFVRAIGLCSTERCQSEYKQLYDRNLFIDSIIFKIIPTMVPTLVEYQKDAVTTLVKHIVNSVRKVKPHLMISVDVTPGLIGQSGFLVQGQDSVNWVNQGIVDVLLEMDYQPTIAIDSAETIRRRLVNRNSLTKLISNMSIGTDLPKNQRPFARSGHWLADTISVIQKRWPDSGIAVYFYKYLSDDQISALKAGPLRVTNSSAAESIGATVR